MRAEERIGCAPHTPLEFERATARTIAIKNSTSQHRIQRVIFSCILSYRSRAICAFVRAWCTTMHARRARGYRTSLLNVCVTFNQCMRACMYQSQLRDVIHQQCRVDATATATATGCRSPSPIRHHNPTVHESSYGGVRERDTSESACVRSSVHVACTIAMHYHPRSEIDSLAVLSPTHFLYL
jgi:hypothetical protein